MIALPSITKSVDIHVDARGVGTKEVFDDRASHQASQWLQIGT